MIPFRIGRSFEGSANLESDGVSRGGVLLPFIRFVRRAAAVGLLLAVAGCSAHLIDSITERLPSSVQRKITPEMAGQVSAVTQHLTPAVVDRLGALAFRARLMHVRISDDAYARRRVETVRARLVAAAAGTRYAEAAKAFAWEVQVIEDDDVNAFALPGGKIGVNTGLLQFTRNDDALLAVALGHELIHALARHAAQRIDKDLAEQLEFAATGLDATHQGASPEATAGLLAAMGIAYEGTTMLPFVRDQELEADREGLLLMAHAGYDPHVAVTFWEDRRLQTQKQDVFSEFLATHPPDEVRIARLHDSLGAAVGQYRPAPAMSAEAGRKRS